MKRVLKRPKQGIAILLLITLLVLAFPGTALAVQGEGDCPSGYQFIARYEWSEGGGPFFEGSGDDVISFTNDPDGSTTWIWTSTVPIDAVVFVDGHETGGGARIITVIPYDPPVTSDTFDEETILGGRGISHIDFCGTTTAVTLSSFSAQAANGRVAVTWITGTEVNNAGFNLYRSSSMDGVRTKVSGGLIAAKGVGMLGASYSFVDIPGYGNFYYWLEDVEYSGLSSLHGPIQVGMQPGLRRPMYRPILPTY